MEEAADSEPSINFCLRAASQDPNVGSSLQLKPCAGKPEEKFFYGHAGQLVLSGWPGMTLCVTAGPAGALSASRNVVLNVCSGHHQTTLAANQKWTAHRTAAEDGDFVWFSNDATELCLGVSAGGPLKVTLRPRRLSQCFVGLGRVLKVAVFFACNARVRACLTPLRVFGGQGLLGGPALVQCPSSDSIATGAVSSQSTFLWETDKLWGSNGGQSENARSAVGSGNSAPVLSLVARRRQPALPKPRSYETRGGLDCLEGMPGNGIDGWPEGIRGGTTHATLEQCKDACDATAHCNSFSFNPGIGDCWLKVRCGEPSKYCKSFEGYKTYFATKGCEGDILGKRQQQVDK